MKNKQILNIMLAFLAIFSLVACDNEPLEGDFGDGTTNPEFTANFQVDIDGVTFTADQSSAQTFMGNTSITGATIDGKIVGMNFSGSGTGTFSLIEPQSSGFYTVPLDSIMYSTIYDGMTGEVTITDYDLQNNLISGTFSFTASRYIDPDDETQGLETKEFTNGTFTNVPLQSDEEPVPELGNFQVDISNGETFVADQSSVEETAEGTTVIGTTEEGGKILMSYIGSGEGTFTLLPQNLDGHASYTPPGEPDHPYFNEFTQDTIGEITITAYDLENNLVSGTFKFIASRFIDPNDESAGVETLEFTNGSFTDVQLIAE